MMIRMKILAAIFLFSPVITSAKEVKLPNVRRITIRQDPPPFPVQLNNSNHHDDSGHHYDKPYPHYGLPLRTGIPEFPFLRNSKKLHELPRSSAPVVTARMSTPTCEAVPAWNIHSIGQTIILKSPNARGKYLNNMDCAWLLYSFDTNARFKIRCSRFRLEAPRNNVCKDYVQMDGGSTVFCGQKFPRKWISTQNSLNFRFFSNHRKNNRGFRCKVTVIDASAIDSTKCSPNPGLVNKLRPGETLTVTSPKFPRRYPRNEYCGWYVEGSDWSVKLRISCDVFSIRSTPECKDYFSVGGTRYCGSNAPSQIIQGTNQAALWFSTTGVRRRGEGFRCTVTGVSSSDPETIAAPGCQCGRALRSNRIIGGIETEENEYPWYVAFVDSNYDFFCGGSIINNQSILTAAHCVYGQSPDFLVIIGAHSWTSQASTEQEFGSLDFITHPFYNPDTVEFDIAIVWLDGIIDFTDPRIAPVCPPDAFGNYYDSLEATVIGLGSITPDGQTLANELQEVTVTTWSLQDCIDAFLAVGYFIGNDMICAGEVAGGKDSCNGDSGGPLITAENDYYVQIGVTSFGHYVCGTPGYPGVYSAVFNPAILTFINQYAGSGYTCPK